jgi:cytochrome c oxidase subunit 1
MTFIEKYVFPLDHKYIGKQYLLTGMFMALFGGFFAYAFRMQLAFPGSDIPFFGHHVAHGVQRARSPTTAR